MTDAERLWREAGKMIDNHMLHAQDMADSHATLNAAVRAAFAAGMDIGMGAMEAAAGVRKEYPPIPPWLPEEKP